MVDRSAGPPRCPVAPEFGGLCRRAPDLSIPVSLSGRLFDVEVVWRE